jgi:fucose permease
LLLLPLLPEILPPFAGILTAVIIYAIGGGLLEVLVSPIMESCPTDNKESAMSLLHSFYCWGHVGVVLISTVFFRVAGIHNWKIMAIIWAVIPVINAILFSRTPIAPLIAPGEKGMTLKELAKNKTFWLLIIMMICAGASENGVVLWSSAFAEKGLQIDKTLGDIAGPMAFAVVMGIARNIHGKHGEKMNLDKLMLWSTVLCLVSYFMMTLFRSPIVNLIGCAACGVSVAIMWPGTLSKASATLRTGGTMMFAMLALAGDIGCSAGPTLVGLVSDGFGGNMKAGILAGILFPAVLLLCILLWKKPKKETL